ncbi:MAG: DNA-binding response regulator, partial [Bacillales bacterium]|nr:DNA-binding response regulator [Bacillales bacterium]
MKKILIIEDDSSIAELQRDYLEAEGYQVDIESSGESGLQRALTEPYDLFILDLMLPNVNGFEICREIRKEHDVPIIFVSAKKEDVDKIRGFRLGADDYIVKPFSPSELVARVKGHISRYEHLIGKQVSKNTKLTVGNIQLDVENR